MVAFILDRNVLSGNKLLPRQKNTILIIKRHNPGRANLVFVVPCAIACFLSRFLFITIRPNLTFFSLFNTSSTTFYNFPSAYLVPALREVIDIKKPAIT